MIVFVLLVVPTAAALLVTLGGASLVQVLGPIALLVLVAVVVAWVTDSRDHRRPLPRIAQKPGLPALPSERLRPWHHVPPPAERAAGRRRKPNTTDSGEPHGCESRPAA
ncbi:hypothetical protein [Streptomyces hygroscopicus]|uniref:hypothetical protein n=1 Tax=Streptomyces hygroscopicus TaxID=1912 RepID=UPI0007670FC0|nr:hypothetical protein [Streptomyces hygroscopicus]